MAKRIVCFALMLLLVCSLFVGCKKEEVPADTSGTNATSDVASETETEVETNKWGDVVIRPDIPDELDYNGAKVTFLMRNSDRFNREFGKEKAISALDGQIYSRNMAVQTELGVVLDFQKTLNGGNNDEFYNTVTNARLAQNGDYDVIVAYAAYGVAPTLRDCYVDLNSDAVTYLKSDKAYWNQSYLEAAELNGKLYYITGDVNLSTFDRSIVVYFNETLCAANGITGLYDKALSGDWTIEDLYTYANNISYMEGDSTTGKSAGDEFTLVSVKWSEACDAFITAFGMKMVSRNDDGTHTVNIGGNQRMYDAADVIKSLYTAAGSHVFGTGEVNDLFSGSSTLFAIDIMWRSDDQNAKYTNMTDKYGILPLPKYDDAQESYYTTPQDAYNIMSIMDDANVNKEMVSATLELMCSKSYDNVRPYYFENVVKTKYFSELDSAKVFELVLNSVTFDIGAVFGSQLGSPLGLWRDACSGKDTLAHAWSENESAIMAELENFEDWMLIS